MVPGKNWICPQCGAEIRITKSAQKCPFCVEKPKTEEIKSGELTLRELVPIRTPPPKTRKVLQTQLRVGGDLLMPEIRKRIVEKPN